MNSTAKLKVHWSKGNESGEGQASLVLGSEPAEVEIAFEPVRGVSLWLDLDPAPALLQVFEIAVLGEGGRVLSEVSDRAAIKRHLTGPGAWWVAEEAAKLLSLCEKKLLRIDVAEASEPAHALRLRIALVETTAASELAQALTVALREQKTEHEAFVRQIDGLLDSLQNVVKTPNQMVSNSLFGRLWRRIRRPVY